MTRSRDSQPHRREHGARPKARQRRSLSHLGGRASFSGDPRRSRELAWAMETGDDTGRALTHGFHAYPARMHPLTAQRIIAARLGDDLKAGGSPPIVCDPFCGSGTVAVEALRAGAAFVGGDISPIGLEIAWVRTRRWPRKRCRQIEARAIRAARVAAELARESRQPPEWVRAESAWYDAPALRDVWALRDAIDTEEDHDLRRVLRMVLSSILVKVSRQVSDATTVRDRHHRPVGPGVAIRMFSRRARELSGQLDALRGDIGQRGGEAPEPRFVQGDARIARLVAPGTAALVLTSPPYLGTYDYLFHHARRFAMLGLPTEYADRHEIGARRRLARGAAGAIARYEHDLGVAVARMKEAVVGQRSIILLVGDGTVGGRVVRADALLRRIASSVGLAVGAMASQRRPNWVTRGSPDARAEHLVELLKA